MRRPPLHDRHCVSVHWWRQAGQTPPVNQLVHRVARLVAYRKPPLDEQSMEEPILNLGESKVPSTLCHHSPHVVETTAALIPYKGEAFYS